MIHGPQIDLIQANLRAKGLSLQHVRGHVGEAGDEAANAVAKWANDNLPQCLPLLPSVFWSSTTK